MSVPHVPVSWGEVIDKITILEIKIAKIKDSSALAHVETEHQALNAIYVLQQGANRKVSHLKGQLKQVNQELWDIEDQIRDQERRKTFDADFIALARAVYHTNDKRSALKREINLLLNSELVEEKSYTAY